MQATRFTRDADQGERIRELENRQVRTMGEHNAMVDAVAQRDAVIAAKTREIMKMQDRIERLQRRLAIPGQAVERPKAPLADYDKVQLTGELDQVCKTRDHYIVENAKLTRKTRRLQRKLDRTNPAINTPVPTCNTPDESEPEMDPADQMAFEALMKRLEDDDDVDDGAK
jgi:hypothetical protein